MESFYGTFKAEFINKHRFSSDEELNDATMDYVYVYYNHVRPHSSNVYMTRKALPIPSANITGPHSSNVYMTPFEKRTQV